MSSASKNDIPNRNAFPVELSPGFTTPRANEPVLIVSDTELELRRDGSVCFRGRGQIALEWLPRPAIRFRADLAIPDIMNAMFKNLLGECEVVTEFPRRTLRAYVTKAHMLSESAVTVRGMITDDVIPSEMEITAASFVLPNFKADLGEDVRDDAGRSLRTARLQFVAEEWRIILDSIRDADKDNKLIDDLEATGGYGITHAGLIERTDKATFRPQELQELLDGLSGFFRSAEGSRRGLYWFDCTQKTPRMIG